MTEFPPNPEQIPSEWILKAREYLYNMYLTAISAVSLLSEEELEAVLSEKPPLPSMLEELDIMDDDDLELLYASLQNPKILEEERAAQRFVNLVYDIDAVVAIVGHLGAADGDIGKGINSYLDDNPRQVEIYARMLMGVSRLSGE